MRVRRDKYRRSVNRLGKREKGKDNNKNGK